MGWRNCLDINWWCQMLSLSLWAAHVNIQDASLEIALEYSYLKQRASHVPVFRAS